MDVSLSYVLNRLRVQAPDMTLRQVQETVQLASGLLPSQQKVRALAKCPVFSIRACKQRRMCLRKGRADLLQSPNISCIAPGVADWTQDECNFLRWSCWRIASKRCRCRPSFALTLTA